MAIVNIKYTGATPGADTNTYNLYDSTAHKPAGFWQHAGLHVYRFDIRNAAAGTVKGYKSATGVAGSWKQVYELACAATAGTTSNADTIPIESYKYFKVDWVNGGSSQASEFVVDQNLSSFP